MSDRHTSRSGVATIALCERLMQPGLLPAHPTTGKIPPVDFGDEFPDKGSEKVVVVSSGIGEDADMEWARLGSPGRDERFTLHVVGRSFVPVPNQTRLDVLRRLIVVADAIQDELFDRVGTRNVIALGYDGEVVTNAVTVAYDVAPSPEGPLGWFDIPVRFQAQI